MDKVLRVEPSQALRGYAEIMEKLCISGILWKMHSSQKNKGIFFKIQIFFKKNQEEAKKSPKQPLK